MKIRNLLLVIAITLASSAALGGLKQPAPVDVDLVNMNALGDMYTARIAEEDNVFIGCGVRYMDFGDGLFAWGFCQAEDAEEDHIVCFTQIESLLDAIKATADYSFVTFSWQDDGGGGYECIRVGFSTQSFYLPKTKK